MRFEKRLDMGAVRSQRMHQGLKHRDAVFGTIGFAAQGGERQPVGGAIGEIELAVGVQVFVLRIDKALACGLQPCPYIRNALEVRT